MVSNAKRKGGQDTRKLAVLIVVNIVIYWIFPFSNVNILVLF